MEILILFALIIFFYLISRMLWLSYMISHLRAGGNVEDLSKWDVLKKVAVKRVNNHLWPGPYFSEFHDTEEIKDWIKKRNWVVAIFWAFAILGIIANFIFHPNPAK